jgi:hypothetical protein
MSKKSENLEMINKSIEGLNDEQKETLKQYGVIK